MGRTHAEEQHRDLEHALICCRGSHRRPMPTWNTNHHCRVVGRCVRPSRYLRAPSRETGKQQRASGWKRRSGVGAYSLARHEQEGWGQTLGCPPHSTGQSAACSLLRGAGAGARRRDPGRSGSPAALHLRRGSVGLGACQHACGGDSAGSRRMHERHLPREKKKQEFPIWILCGNAITGRPGGHVINFSPAKHTHPVEN